MTPALPVDERTFESNEALTPEQQQQAADYFEKKGIEISVETDEPVAGQPPAAAPPAQVPAVEPPKADAPPPAGSPPAPGAPATEEHETDPEWVAAKTETEKLGYNARRTKKLKEQAETITREQAAKEALARENAELKGRLAERPPAAAIPASSPLAPPSAAAPAKPPEPPKAQEFSKAAPAVPVFDPEVEDPSAKLATDMANYAKSMVSWEFEKRDFERAETTRVEQEASQQRTVTQRIEQKFVDVRRSHSDFDEKTKSVNYSRLLGGVLLQMLPDGLELGYSLAQSEHAETLKAINEYTKDIDPEKDSGAYQEGINRALQDLGVFRWSLTHPASAPPAAAAPPPNAPPAVAPPAAPAPVPAAAAPAAPVSTGQPVREDGAPQPVRGRDALPAQRYEDIPEDDVDARLKFRRDNKMAW